MRKYLKFKGFGLLELMLSLVIVALLLIMATRYYQTTVLNSKVNGVITLINAITASASAYYGINSNFTNVAQAAGKGFIQSGIPKSLVNNSVIQGPWGGTAGIAIAAGSNATSYKVTVPNVPEQACYKLNGYFENNSKLVPATTTCAATPTDWSYNYDIAG
jgi:prepilin-type N-terminal cleavage/methylation domain-containing protein